MNHAADANQARASDPSASAWVSANAGTGKTEVLVRRVLRLLLAGSEPQRILCLTYTKMAAAEMQNRLLKELAAWATLEDGTLRERLAALLGRGPDDAEVKAARRLFAQTLEAKGGLKIYTIHGFCERLLQRFPLEAEVTPNFAVLDEAAALRLKGEAFDAVMARAAKERDAPLGQALAKIVAVTVEDYFRKMVDTVLAKRGDLARMMALHESDPDWTKREERCLKRLFGLGKEVCEAELTERLADVLADSDIDTLLAALEGNGAESRTDQELRDGLQAARAATGAARVAALKPIFLTDKNTPRRSVCSKGLWQAEPLACAVLDRAQDRFDRLATQRAQLACAEASSAVLLLADTIQAEYDRAKQSHAVLDYDDLIFRTKALLSHSGAAAWVLYKIDGGVDHILVDEAQDTNPEQWSIIERLAEEFFAGEGASDNLRTLFAVGDEKQSIYSFQGADPVRFGTVGRTFRAKAMAIKQTWNDVSLTLSFRSTEAVLKAVDAVFSKRPAAEGLIWHDGEIIKHHAFRTGQAGLVELWPVVSETKIEPAEAFEPWNEDAVPPHAVDVLCRRIAGQIKAWRDKGEELESEGRKIKAGDILILVRRRDPLTAPMIRALKREKIAVAGADRMQLLQQIAVMDLMALADVLLMPEDDLSLAVTLKSPLFGLNDDHLFELAFERRTSLWNVLQAKAKGNVRFKEAAETLSRWLSRVDLKPPYEFFLELLGENGQEMRKRMLTRLGPEAAESLDEFLDLALGFDTESPPSLQGFVNAMRSTDVEIKRDMEQKRDEVRIMTVHGAKGLQAPIVFLPDTCVLPRRQGASIHTLVRHGVPPEEVGHIVWPAGGNTLEHIEAAKDLARKAEIEEYHRLLYVAMTRARDRLYVCGWSQKDCPEKASWYELVDQGLKSLLAETACYDGKPVQRLISEQTIAVKASCEAEAAAEGAELPDWASRPAPEERSRAILTPSGLGALLGDTASPYPEQPPLGPRALADNRRFARGRLVHTLLQHLPEVAAADREGAARTFVAARGRDLPEEMRGEIVSETLAIVQDTRFAPLFAPGSLSEVPIVARLGDGDISGQIDRLAVLDDALLVLDYKTNRPPPSTPDEVAPGYIAQLAAYRAALRLMFPERALRAAIIWTDGPKLMEIPSTLLDLAERRMLQKGPSLDVAWVRT
ncbi:MAG TPA: double-strand break repair helicase AddA [Methyloceanibacter sp.]|nr:double-strand break repair helicase AddA [Methyloceanibacter sp.]